jgi:hypothetical protein
MDAIDFQVTAEDAAALVAIYHHLLALRGPFLTKCDCIRYALSVAFRELAPVEHLQAVIDRVKAP